MAKRPRRRGVEGNAIRGGIRRSNVVQARSIGTLNLNAPTMPAMIPGFPPPRALPAPTVHFTDRNGVLDEATELIERSSGRPVRLAFVGPGGVGKSATGLRIGTHVLERFADGHLHVNLRGSAGAAAAATPSEVLVGFLHQLGIDPRWVPHDEETQANLFRSVTHDKRILVFLDDAASVAQIRPLLTGSSRSLTIVTSRWGLAELGSQYGARIVRLGPMEDRHAVRLLRRVAGDRARSAGQDAHIEAVARLCGGLPMALCTAATRVANRAHVSWERVERDLVDGRAGMSDDDDATDLTRAMTQGTYDDMSRPAERLYRLLGTRPWPEITAGLAAAALDVPEAQARRYLDELLDGHLLEEIGDDLYRMHDLIRRDAERRALREDGPAGITAALRRMVRCLLRQAASADNVVIEGRWHLGPVYATLDSAEAAAYPSAASALTALERLRATLDEAMAVAVDYGFDELAWQLCEASWAMHLRLGYHTQWIRNHLLGVQAAISCGDPRAEGRMRCQLAFGYMGCEQFADAEAQLEAAARVDHDADHARGEATALESLGLLRLQQRRPDEAVTYLEQAWAVALRVGDPRALALLTHHKGRVMGARGHYEQALELLKRAETMMRALETPDPYNVARVLTSRAETLLASGRADEAREPLARAAETMAAEHAVVEQARVAELRATCARTLGDRVAAADFLRAALAFHTATGSPAIARVRAELAQSGESEDASES